MNTKLRSKIQHLLVIVVMLLNPLIVSADALFLDKNASIVYSTMASTMSSDAEKHANCHDDKSIAATQELNEKADCCEGPCECGASGCHSPLAAFSSNKSLFVTSIYALNYLRDHYLSFVSSPSSPPPIV